jgi:epoxyqueuosine reductase
LFFLQFLHNLPLAVSATPEQLAALSQSLRDWGRELGFADVRVADIDLGDADAQLQSWLDAGYHGHMDYMAAHGSKRARPAELVPGTLRVICARMPYLPRPADAGAANGRDWRAAEDSRHADPSAAVISVYARGRDYHKVLRARLQQLADRIAQAIGPFGYRVFTDSAPVMEVELAQRSGLGWRGKHTLLLNRDAGSMFFLGEIYTDLPLPVDEATTAHCGECRACIDVCPTQAIVGPYRLDARRCISYLTIELKDSIPEDLRPLIGNRVLGCDDCQLACPWNKFAQHSELPDFDVRNGLDSASLVDLFAWSEQDFHARLEGSAIRRIGHERWLRNIAVALGNAASGKCGDPALVAALRSRAGHPSAMVREHVQWALARHGLPS